MKQPLIAILTAAVAAAAPVLCYAQTQTIQRQYNRVIIYERNDGSRICYDFEDIARIEHELTYDESDAVTSGLRFVDITDKSKWSIPYGSVAMSFGPFSQMIDAKEDNGGWMGFIDNGFNNSPGLGHPFVVVDLGENIRLAGLGIQAGELQAKGAYDVMPAKVDFYITDRDDVAVELTDRERQLMNGAEGDNHDEYLTLHRKLKDADAQFGWKKVGSVVIGAPEKDHVGRYFYHLNSSQIADNLTARYVKLDVTPFNCDRTGDRTKIFEFYVRAIAD